MAADAWSTTDGSTASISRAPTCATADRSTPRIATAISSPTTGSAQGSPIATPAAPTARLLADLTAVFREMTGRLVLLAVPVAAWVGVGLAVVGPVRVTGDPAVSLPLATSAAGLPIGVQLSAARGRDRRLLEVAYELEAARPFARIQD